MSLLNIGAMLLFLRNIGAVLLFLRNIRAILLFLRNIGAILLFLRYKCLQEFSEMFTDITCFVQKLYEVTLTL